MERSRERAAVANRLRSLIRANSALVEDLSIETVLRRIVEAAVSLVDADYGALGVQSADGTLERFIHVGASDAEVAAIGDLPTGKGLLGAVIESARTIRLPRIADDPRSSGFPANHPTMESFLGVPIRVRNEVYGNLYLTNRERRPFSDDDEELIRSLAATAGIAIENARLMDASERRRRTAVALAEITSGLLAGREQVLAVIAEHVGIVLDAEFVSVVVPEDGGLDVHLVHGGRTELRGELRATIIGLAAQALDAGVPVSDERRQAERSGTWPPELGPSIALPLKAGDLAIGALTLSRPSGAPSFDAADLATAAEFAVQAGVAIELERARDDRQRLQLVGERARIARDLHDHVIQRLFATSLALEALADASPLQSDDILEQADAVDAAIADIRTAVFTLAHGARSSIRHRVLDIASDLAPHLGFTPRIVFGGPVELFVTDSLADDVAAVVREALSNAARHAAAGSGAVEIAVEGRCVRITVDDDGRGLPAEWTRSSGTNNLALRAQARSGGFSLLSRPEGGTRLEWTADLDAKASA